MTLTFARKARAYPLQGAAKGAPLWNVGLLEKLVSLKHSSLLGRAPTSKTKLQNFVTLNDYLRNKPECFSLSIASIHV